MKELLEKLDLIQSELNHINGKLDNTLDNLKIIKNELNIMNEFRFEKGKDYYLENGNIVYTEEYLKRRGTCCGGGCRHCVFDPMHTKGNKNLREDLGKNLTDSE